MWMIPIFRMPAPHSAQGASPIARSTRTSLVPSLFSKARKASSGRASELLPYQAGVLQDEFAVGLHAALPRRLHTREPCRTEAEDPSSVDLSSNVTSFV